MKILYLHQYFVAPHQGGGTRSYEFARRLVDDGHEVTVITSDPESDKRILLWRREKIDRINIYYLNVTYSNNMAFSRRIVSFILFMILSSVVAITVPKKNIVFATSTPLTICIPGLIAKYRHRAKYIFEVRDLWPEVPISVGALNHIILKKMALALEKFAYFTADAVVTLSPGMTDGVRKIVSTKKQVITIPNSCDKYKVDVFEEFNFQEKYLCYCGQLGKINGLEFLINLALLFKKANESIQIVVVGDGAERQKLMRSAREVGLEEEQLVFTGHLNKFSVMSIMNQSVACIGSFLPILEMEKNSSNKFFDALALGKPIIINYKGWQARLLEQHECGITIPHDISVTLDIAPLIELVHDNVRLKKLANNSRTLGKQKFSRDIHYKDLKCLFNLLVTDDKDGVRLLQEETFIRYT